MRALTHVTLSVEPDDEVSEPSDREVVPVLVVAEVGYSDDQDVVAVADRAIELDPTSPAEAQVRTLCLEELLDDLAAETNLREGTNVTAEDLAPHVQIVLVHGLDEVFPAE